MTLTLDKDLADALKERARAQSKTIKQVVNDALRQGLSVGVKESPREPYRVKPFHSGFAPGVDPTKLNQLNDQLELEELLRKLNK